MKKIIGLFLLLVSINGYCDWVKFTTSDSLTVYIEPSSIKKTKNSVRLWTLYNFSNTQKLETIGTYKSFKSYDEYDCAEDKTRNLSLLFYGEEMGEGKNIFSNNRGGEWHYQPPNSVGLSLVKFSCDKM